MTPEEFKEQIVELCDIIDNDAVVGEMFESHPSVVRRWKSGVACPLPRLREIIIHELRLLVEKMNK